jgi:hypothetical protein
MGSFILHQTRKATLDLVSVVDGAEMPPIKHVRASAQDWERAYVNQPPLMRKSLHSTWAHIHIPLGMPLLIPDTPGHYASPQFFRIPSSYVS